MNAYLPGDVVDQCKDALRHGVELSLLAERLGCSTDTLAKLLDVPALKPAGGVCGGSDSAAVDLWADDQPAAVGSAGDSAAIANE
jgi:hypothetical protein